MKNKSIPTAKIQAAPPPAKWITSALTLTLVCAVFLAYYITLCNHFLLLNWDDQLYISQNPLITSPLTWHSFIEMFTKPVVGTYCGIPQLTWWLDLHLSGMHKAHVPGTPPDTELQYVATVMYFTNVLLHTLNTILVFASISLVCQQLNFGKRKSLFIAFVTALIWGIHTQHVESVAWVTERKDLTYSLFFLLAVYSYLRIRKNTLRTTVTTLFFILSLLSKGQAVALAPTLVLIDYLIGVKPNWKAYVVFFSLAILFGITAILGQQSSDAFYYTGINSTFWSFVWINPSYAIWGYIQHFIFPVNLLPLYRFPFKQFAGTDDYMRYIYPWFTIAALILLWYNRRNKPLIFCILFFLFNIALLLQFIPVGGAIMADRYMYISSIGLCFLVALGINYLWSESQSITSLILTTITILLIFNTWHYSAIWKTDLNLWRQQIAQTPFELKSYENLSEYYGDFWHQKDSMMFYSNKAIELGSGLPKMYDYRINYYLENNQVDSALIWSKWVMGSGIVKKHDDSVQILQDLRTADSILTSRKGIRQN